MNRTKRCATEDWFHEDKTFSLIDELFCEAVNPENWYHELACTPEDSNDGIYQVFYTNKKTFKTIVASLEDARNRFLKMEYGGEWSSADGNRKKAAAKKAEEKEFTFHNVTVTLSASNGKEAYTNLCNAFASAEVEWATHTYSEESEPDNVKSTAELFPDV